MWVMVVTLFPRLRLVPEVSRDRVTVKLSTFSVTLSEMILMEGHMRAPSPEPGAKVRDVESNLKSPSPTVATP
jgi:hypothetical protein